MHGIRGPPPAAAARRGRLPGTGEDAARGTRTDVSRTGDLKTGGAGAAAGPGQQGAPPGGPRSFPGRGSMSCGGEVAGGADYLSRYALTTVTWYVLPLPSVSFALRETDVAFFGWLSESDRLPFSVTTGVLDHFLPPS
ncbi:hypothetical protein EES45_31790 [Streptomyces sp. ADI97-07]|nr:hypothetical protein EES45_31790 [Streptomyces sp. ADI97-07]